MGPIQVALFKPTQMACELLKYAIESSCNDIQVISARVDSEFENDSELAKADVAVISLLLEEDRFGGLKLLRRLVGTLPSLNCILLLDKDDRDIDIEAFRSGAVGIFDRGDSLGQLCKCIRCVSEGQVWANSRQQRYLLESLVRGLSPLVTDWKGHPHLSRREQEIVSKVAEGMTNREVAGLLSLSEHTVKNHLFRIFERLGISSRTELILYLHNQKPPAENREMA